MTFSICVRALNMYITPIPMRIIVVEVIFLNTDIPRMRNAGIRANTKAFAISPMLPDMGMMLTPRTTNREAPMEAPEDTPVV